jgi:hypothetical protein
MTIITKIEMGRTLTAAEQEQKTIALDAAVNAGTTDGTSTNTIFPGVDTLVIGIRIWTTTDAANSYIALFNSFGPAPITAEVLTV